MRTPLACLATAAFLASTILPARAAAYERQWHFGVGLGYLGGWNDTGHGLGGGVDLGYGVRDWLDVVAAADVTYHPRTKIVLPTITTGVRFAFDVLQVVPYVGAQVGFAEVVWIGDTALSRLDLAVPFGVDYQVSRSFTVGLAGRFQLLLASGSPTPMLGVFARAAYVWGY